MNASLRALPYLAFLALGGLLFPSSGRDDTYITLWSARTLAEYGEILNYSGERLEQSSSLLHTVLLALLSKGVLWLPGLANEAGTAAGALHPADWGMLAWLISIAAGLWTVRLSGVLAGWLDLEPWRLQLLVASCVPLTYWSFSGMETSLVSAAVLQLCICGLRCEERWAPARIAGLGVATLALELLRPEAFYVLCAFWFGLGVCALIAGRAWRVPAAGLALAAAGFVAIAGFRLGYFGALFPQPVTAKAGHLDLAQGWRYLSFSVRDQYPALMLFAVPWIAFLVQIPRAIADPKLLVPAMFALAQISAILAAGGGWMEGLRLLVPALPLVVAVGYAAYTGDRERGDRERAARAAPGRSPLDESDGADGRVPRSEGWLFAGLVAAQLASVAWFGWHWSTGWPLLSVPAEVEVVRSGREWRFYDRANRHHHRDIQLIPRLVEVVEQIDAGRSAAGRSEALTIMSLQAGMVPFYLSSEVFGRIPIEFIDGAALSSRHFTSCALTADNQSVIGNPFFRLGRETHPYKRFFERSAEFETRCGLSRPDIIYDIPRDATRPYRVFEDNGYVIVHRQHGEAQRAEWFPGRIVPGAEMIAVKRELAAMLSRLRNEVRL